MVTTRRVSTKKKLKWKNPNWDIGAAIVALIGSALLFISLLSRPSFSIIHQHVVLTQGIVAPAVIMGSVVWAIIEFFTPPSTGIKDLLIRIIPAFIIGALVGGTLGYMYHFGQYVIRPAMSGNIDALWFLIGILVAALAVTWNAAWSDKHGYLGQRGKGFRKLNTHESGTEKGRRGMLFLLIIVIVLLVAAPIGAAIGSAFVSGHDNTPVLSNVSDVQYINSKAGAVPFGTVNGTTTFDMPANVSTVYLQTNMTLAELNDYSVSHILLSTSISNYNLTVGTGNVTSFAPLFSINVHNSTSTNITLPTYRLTGIQSSPLVLEITTPSSVVSVTLQAYGNNGFVTSFGPYQVLQASYLIGGIIMFASAFLVLSMYDLSLDAITGSFKASRGGK